MANKATTAKIQRRYEVTDFPHLFAQLISIAAVLLGSEATFSGRFRRTAEPDVELEFKDLEAFTEHLAESVIRLSAELTAGVWPDQSSLRVRRHSEDSPVEVTIQIDTSRLDEVRSVIAGLEKDFGIVALTDERTGDDDATAQLERNYFCSEAQVERWLTLFRRELAPLVSPYSFTARVRASGIDSPILTYSDPERFLAELPPRISRVDLDVSRDEPPYSRVVLNFDSSYQPALHLRAYIVPGQLDRTRAAMDRLEADLGLQRSGDGAAEEKSRIGSVVTGFTRVDLDSAWFEKACAAVEQLEPWQRWFTGSLQQRINGSKERRYSSMKAWKEAALAHWPQVLFAGGTLEGPTYTLSLDVEPKLHLVRLEVRAEDENTAAAVSSRLLEQLDVDAQETDAYTAADRYEARFWFDPWNRTAYAKIVADVIDQFVSREPIIMRGDTWVAERIDDDSSRETYTYFDDLSAFTARLVDEKEYLAAAVYARGPKGRTIFMRVFDGCTKLEVRSSIEASRFADVVKALKRNLKLRSPDDWRDDERKEQKLSILQQFWRLKGLPGKIASGLVGAAIGAGGFLAMNAIPRYEVQLLLPYVRGDEPAQVNAGCVEVTWLVMQNHWPLLGKPLEDQKGTVHFRPATGGRLPPIKDFPSGDEIHIPPGRWTLYVSDSVRGATSPIIEIVADDDHYDEQRESTIARCGQPPNP